MDHENKYLELTGLLGRLNGVNQDVKYWNCPLTHIEGLDKLWYCGLVDKLAEINKMDVIHEDTLLIRIEDHLE